MEEKGEKGMRRDWVSKHLVGCSVAGVILLPVLALTFLLVRFGGFDPDVWAGLAEGLLAYVGACFVGILAVWQNQKFREENKKSQKRLDDFNERLMKIEFARATPAFDMQILGFANFVTPPAKGAMAFDIEMINVGQTPMTEIYALRGELVITELSPNPKRLEINLLPCYIGAVGVGKSKKWTAAFDLSVRSRGATYRLEFLIKLKDMLGETHWRDVKISYDPDENKISNLTIRPSKMKEG